MHARVNYTIQNN